MRLLLDTHIILWSAAEPDRLSRRILDKLEDPGCDLWFSPISVWETLLLAEKGQILLQGNMIRAVRHLFRRIPFKEAPLNQEVAIQSRRVHLPHEDPADRFLVATALVYDLTFVTADKRIIEARAVPILSAL